MKPYYACNSIEHRWSRRQFLGGTAAGLGVLGFGDMVRAAGDIERQNRRVLVIFMAGGLSQLESWDPKPGTNTGGPFQAIPTSIPGTHISELLPYSAGQAHRLALVRGINNQENDHGKGAYFMQTDPLQTPAKRFPHLSSVIAKQIAPQDKPRPGYIHISPRD